MKQAKKTILYTETLFVKQLRRDTGSQHFEIEAKLTSTQKEIRSIKLEMRRFHGTIKVLEAKYKKANQFYEKCNRKIEICENSKTRVLAPRSL